MNLNISNLPDNVDELKAIILDYQAEVERLEEHIRILRACIFGRKSEKTPRTPVNQKTLFDMPEPETPPSEEKIEIRSHKRKKPGRKPIPEDLPREEKVIDIPEEEKTCACGAELVRIGEEVSEKLDIIPARVKVIRTIRPKYACKKCEGASSEEAPSVKVAPAPLEIIPRSIATSGLLAYILVAKFVDHMPFYR
ncbi:MAG TPA: IS66 family transposase, partial [Desulfobacterales bacterium]|nr:IS66 family transposase [Desulfobacterales bacterium]